MDLEQSAIWFGCLIVAVILHEISHGVVALWFGDHTAKDAGRLTLNPIPHIDPIGALMLVVAGFGWAKPVMVNPAALRGGARGMALVAFAGPIANVVVAIGFAILYRVLDIVGIDAGFVLRLIQLIVALNLLLAIFNLVPIPPLDGYNVLIAFLPPRQAMVVRQYAPYGVILLLLLVFLPGSPLGALLRLAVPLSRALTGA